MKQFRFGKFVLSVVAGLGVTVMAGCTRNSSHSHDEPKTAQISVWTERYEIFAEHRTPVAGKATTFVTHVTDLHTLEPRREGPVKFVLRQGEALAEHSEASPARAGIYLPGIVFPKPGDWQMNVLIPVDGTNALADLGTIKVYPDEHSAAHAEIADGPEGISFLKEQQWKILSKTEPVTKRVLTERFRVPARVRAKPGFSTTVAAPVSGELTNAGAGQNFPLPGERVEAGKLLALLKPNFSEATAKVAEANADFATAKASLDQAEIAYGRTKKLAAEQAKSPRELQEAELAYQSAKARFAGASGLLSTFKQASEASPREGPLLMELRAPISGFLDFVAAGPGENVSANAPLFTVINPERVWIEARIPESSLTRLSAGKNASLELLEERGTFIPISGEGRGKFVSLGLEIDPLTRTVPLIYETTNAGKVADLSTSIFWLVLPSLVFFLLLPKLLRMNINFFLSFGAATVAMLVSYGAMLVILKKFGINF